MQTCKKCFREIGEYPFCPYCGASQGSNLLTLEQIYSECQKERIAFGTAAKAPHLSIHPLNF